MNKIVIEGNAIYLNDVQLKDVVSYELKNSAADPGKPTAEFTVKLLVDPSKLSFNSFTNDIDSNLSEGVQRE